MGMMRMSVVVVYMLCFLVPCMSETCRFDADICVHKRHLPPYVVYNQTNHGLLLAVLEGMIGRYINVFTQTSFCYIFLN